MQKMDRRGHRDRPGAKKNRFETDSKLETTAPVMALVARGVVSAICRLLEVACFPLSTFQLKIKIKNQFLRPSKSFGLREPAWGMGPCAHQCAGLDCRLCTVFSYWNPGPRRRACISHFASMYILYKTQNAAAGGMAGGQSRV